MIAIYIVGFIMMLCLFIYLNRKNGKPKSVTENENVIFSLFFSVIWPVTLLLFVGAYLFNALKRVMKGKK